MDWSVQFGVHCGAAVVKTFGPFDVDDHRRMVEDIVSRPEWTPGQRILFDHWDLDFGDAKLHEMLAARTNHREHEDRIGNARTALLMKPGADYGLGRQFQMLSEHHVTAELAVFSDLRKAVAWLCK